MSIILIVEPYIRRGLYVCVTYALFVTMCITYQYIIIYLKVYCKLYFKIYGKKHIEKIRNKIVPYLICSDKCNICLEPVIFHPRLNLECKCKYTVHYSCYNTWWENNKTCIICRNKTNNIPKINKCVDFINTKKLGNLINALAAFTLIILGYLLLEFRNTRRELFTY